MSWVTWAIAIGLVVFVTAWFVPTGACDVQTNVSFSQTYVCVLTLCGASFSIPSFTAASAGYTALLDFNSLVGSLANHPGAIFCALSCTFLVQVWWGSHLGEQSFQETKLDPVIGAGFTQTVSDTYTIGGVHPGEQTMHIELLVDGSSQAASSTTLQVGCMGN